MVCDGWVQFLDHHYDLDAGEFTSEGDDVCASGCSDRRPARA